MKLCSLTTLALMRYTRLMNDSHNPLLNPQDVAKAAELAQDKQDTHVKSFWVTTTELVFPTHANSHNTVFGGRVLELMDLNAAIACFRFCRLPIVTASIEPIDFRNPIYIGEIIDVRSRVAWVGRTSMIVRCEVYGENPLSGERRLCTVGHLSFVALIEGKPVEVPDLQIDSHEERQHYQEALRAREMIQARRNHQKR